MFHLSCLSMSELVAFLISNELSLRLLLLSLPGSLPLATFGWSLSVEDSSESWEYFCFLIFCSSISSWMLVVLG